jgi:hypothetical protein
LASLIPEIRPDSFIVSRAEGSAGSRILYRMREHASRMCLGACVTMTSALQRTETERWRKGTSLLAPAPRRPPRSLRLACPANAVSAASGARRRLTLEHTRRSRAFRIQSYVLTEVCEPAKPNAWCKVSGRMANKAYMRILSGLGQSGLLGLSLTWSPVLGHGAPTISISKCLLWKWRPLG